MSHITTESPIYADIEITQIKPNWFKAESSAGTHLSCSFAGVALKAYLSVFKTDEGFDDFLAWAKLRQPQNVLPFPRIYQNVKYRQADDPLPGHDNDEDFTDITIHGGEGR